MLPHGATDLEATFEAIDRVLEVSTIAQKEIIFLTDLQSTSWRRRESTGKDRPGQDPRRSSRRGRPRSVIIDLGRAGSENRAVTDLRIEAPVVTAGSTAMVRGVVRNFGPSKAEGVLVRLTVDGRVGPEQSVDLPVGEDVPIIFNQQFATPGDHVLEVAMDNDQLPLDDRRWLVVPVRESLNVLLVDGHFKSEPFQAETDYLAQALAPTEGSPGQPGMIRAEVVSESQLLGRELGPYDVVALCNVAQFSQAEVTALEDFLKQGGGLVIFGGDQVIAENYNRLLHADGKGLLPAALGAAVGDAAKKEAAFGFDPRGYRHPLVAEFRGESDPVTAGLTQALTWQYHKLVIPKDSTAQVALAFDNGDPAVIEAPRARGKVFLVATSADAGWTTWPLHNSYPAESCSRWSSRPRPGGWPSGTSRSVSPTIRPFPPAAASASASVVNPRGVSVPTRLKAPEESASSTSSRPRSPGSTRCGSARPRRSRTLSRPTPTRPRATRPSSTRAGLQQRIPGWNFAYLTNWRELTRSAASVGRRGELHRPLALWRPGRASPGIVPGLEVRPSRFHFLN